jgi:hypothetical protein
MDASGRSLRSRVIVPPERSPKKGPEGSRKKAAEKTAPKEKKKGKNDGGKGSKEAGLATALEKAKKILEDGSEEEFVEVVGKKRARNEKKQEAEQVAQAQELAEGWMEADKYAKEIVERKQEAQESLLSYKAKANLAKKLPKNAKTTAKQLQIDKKIESIKDMLTSLEKVTKKRYNELFTAALEETMTSTHAGKKRRVQSEASESDGLEVSEGKPFFCNFPDFPLLSPRSTSTQRWASVSHVVMCTIRGVFRPEKRGTALLSRPTSQSLSPQTATPGTRSDATRRVPTPSTRRFPAPDHTNSPARSL